MGKPRAMADQQPNKWGWYGWNCKWRPSGAGTTHANRRAARAHLQWDNLQVREPDTAAGMEEQLRALEKAQEKAKQRLQELQAEEPLEKGSKRKAASSSSSSSSSSSTRERSQLRRSRIAKSGKPQRLMEVVEEEPLEKGKVKEEAQEEGKPLEKGKVNEEGKELGAKPLEKGKQAELGAKPLEKGKQAEEKEIGLKPLEKGKQPLEKGKDQEPLGKGQQEGPQAEPLGKGSKDKPIVVVDWHKTLALKGGVPPKHLAALRTLLQVASVHIVSYVETWTRAKEVAALALALPCRASLSGVHTCWRRTGKHGKAAWCKYLGATVIFDDCGCGQVIQECDSQGLLALAICTKDEQHHGHRSSLVFKDFPEAVHEFLDMRL